MTLGTGTESSIVIEVTFWVLAISTVISAIAVVHIRDLFRASLFLIVTFLGVAGMFILLRAEFLAGVQLMIYVGAISVLLIFAILMTRELENGNQSHFMRVVVGLISTALMLLSIYLISETNWNLLSESGVGNDDAVIHTFSDESIPTLAKMLLADYLLAFEMVSVLLLAAVLGALALVREDKK